MRHQPSSLPGRIASLIADSPAQSMHPNFFDKLDQQLRKKGFRIVANQRGVMGTHLSIQRVEEPSDG